MTGRLIPIPLLFLLIRAASPLPVFAQLYSYDTEDMQVVYTSTLQSYLVPHIARSFENSLRFHRQLFDYEPSEPVEILVHDLWHYGNAGARPLPRNHITLGIAPYAHAMETSPANERINSSLNHEIVHLATTDKAAPSDRFFRSMFGGKVALSEEDPVSLVYSYLTTPRWYTPRWYLEGIAVYLETWMGGGYGRAIGAYDEMVFRSKVLDSERLFDFVGLESEGTTVDFQVGANSYLYGTRFVSYVGHTFGQEKLIDWFDRRGGTKRSYLRQFKHLFGRSLDDVWSDWLQWEREWQRSNLERVHANPLTDYRRITERALGSVSRAFLDPAKPTLYVAARLPGQMASILAIDVRTGEIKKVSEVVGAAGLYVTSLAYDSTSGTLFYTSNNKNWRHLKAIDTASGQKRLLLKDARVGDLAFNTVDKSLWAVRHFNGVSTIVRFEPPYDQWNQIFSLPYGLDVFDLDVSPDGKTLVGSMMEISGKQFLVRMDTEALLRGETFYEKLFEFGNWEPQNFTYSSDGRYLFGSSYYSGVSNIYRYDVQAEEMEPLSNTDTGLFRPVQYSADSLVAFRYSGSGFVPVMIPNTVPEAVSAIKFLGNEIRASNEEVQNWTLPPPSDIQVEAVSSRKEDYKPIRNVRFDSVYPIVQGYQDASGRTSAAVGLRANGSDEIGFVWINGSATYSPSPSLDVQERFHAHLNARYRAWHVGLSYNRADFYDLFGPTKTSRKGVNANVEYQKNLIYDDPKTLDYRLRFDVWSGLETLPEYQSVVTSFSDLASFSGTLTYDFMRQSLGAIESEAGVGAEVGVRSSFVNNELFPKAFANISYGILLPLDHSSAWLRLATGSSFRRDADEPFANFFFGGFGNNWVDYQSVKRYREYYSFPGTEINTIAGTNFGRVQLEWVLPPLRFRRFGFPNLYLRWASLSLIGGGLITEIDRNRSAQRRVLDFGGQLDFRLVSFSTLSSTLSVGYAVMVEDGEDMIDEWMISLKIL
ncbi:MAG: hypothetical protein KJO98_07555 [Rhodothermia bacterium]|nr:hypothetical protein [Rhodothermia bacterium]